MGSVAGPDLVAEVSKAGGLGIVGGLGLPPDDLRNRIRQVRQLTDRPFGVNQWLHTELRPPVDPSSLAPERVAAVNAHLNNVRARLGLPEKNGPPAPVPDLIRQGFEVILEERVPVWSIGLGDPGPEMVKEAHARGVKVVAMASTLADCLALHRSGVDVIFAQGGEAGGHRSTWVKRDRPEKAAVGTLALVREVVRAIDRPIAAAGGIVDGRGLLAALALGAEGVLLGTRFLATRESAAPEFHKRALLDGDGDATTLADGFTGLYARMLRNRYTEDYRASGAPVFPALLQSSATKDIVENARATNDGEHYTLYAGQGVGAIDDLPGAGDVVRRIMAEAAEGLAQLRRLP
jgi:nitronate monooxygenase